MKINKLIIGVLIGIFSFINVEAASLSFDGSKTIKNTESSTIDIKLNTDSEEISKVEFELEYDSSIISINGDVPKTFGGQPSGNRYYIFTDGRAIDDKAIIASLTINNKSSVDTTTTIKIKNIRINGTDVSSASGDTKDLELKTITTTTQAPKNTSAKLSNISVNGYNLNPTFDKDTTEYKLNLTDSVRSFNLLMSCEEKDCVKEVSCETSGCTVAGNKITPIDGKNIVTILVTSQDNENTQKYTLTVYKGKTTDDSEYLSSLEIDKLKLNETFEKEKLDYTITVDNSVDSLNIKATPEDDKAEIKIKGNEKFQLGENVVTITVTSSETKKTKIYNITVTKEEETTTTTTTKKVLTTVNDNNNNPNKTIIIIAIGIVGLAIIGISGYFIFRKKTTVKDDDIKQANPADDDLPSLKQDDNFESPTEEDTVDVDTALMDLMNTKELELTKEYKNIE